MLIYKATFPNQKSYIGQTRFSLEKRKLQHLKKSNGKYNVIFIKAIRKYGWENVQWEIIENNISDINILNEREQFNILKYDTFMPNGYNMTLGGDGSLGKQVSQITKKKLRDANIGKKLTNKHKNKISNSHIGLKHTKETKEIIGQYNKIRKNKICINCNRKFKATRNQIYCCFNCGQKHRRKNYGTI